MTNCESREAVCVIKEEEVVWTRKGKRSEGRAAGEVQEEMSVTREEGLSWRQESCKLPGGSGELTGFSAGAPGICVQEGKEKGWSRIVPGKDCCPGSLDRRPRQTEGSGNEMEAT